MDGQEAGASALPLDDDVNDSQRAPMLIMPPPPAAPPLLTGLENPAKVRNLRDILHYSTQMTEICPQNRESGPMVLTLEEEKKKFLKNVLSTMTVNVHEEMNNSINILLDSDKPAAEYEYALDVIGEHVDTIDYANDFQKLGGFQMILPCLKSVYPTVRSKTAELISTIVQHNPYCQDKFIEIPAYMRFLMSLVENDSVEDVRVKAFLAISSVVRHNVSGFWKFIALGGNDLIVYALKSSSDKLKLKSVFLIYSSCHMGNDIADMYVDNGVVQVLCSIIMDMEKTVENYHHEVFLSSLNQLLRMSPGRVKEICSSTKDFKLSLLSLQNSYPNDSNYQDEKDQILWMMETLTL